jgi:hypothetical protein
VWFQKSGAQERAACGAGDSIKPGVERRGTPGWNQQHCQPAKAGGSGIGDAGDRQHADGTVPLSPAFAGRNAFLDLILGLTPQALR